MTEPMRAPGDFPVVGIIGGGQLARMCQPPAVGLCVTLSVLSEAPDGAAALVVPSAPIGQKDDLEAIRDFAKSVDVVTFDHELVPQHILQVLQEQGVPMHPSPAALIHAQDKLVMRRRLTDLGLPCPAWAQVSSVPELAEFGAQHGLPLILKTPRGGYDGRGVRLVHDPKDAQDWFDRGEPLLAEQAVDFTRELAVMVARSPSGQGAVWPVVHTVQTDGICTEVIAPAPDLDDDLAGRITQAALRIAGELGVTGVMAVELFETRDGDGRPDFVVNELAMRPHNSGHWSIEGSVTSQFEQHLRAVLDLPLGEVSTRSRWTVMANVLGGEYTDLYPTYRHLLARDPGLKLHLYGKGVRPGRKIGHVTVCGDDLDDLRARAQHAAGYLQGTITE